MEERLFEFYCSLPKLSQYPFYIKGYHEAFERVEGVRVIPSFSFTEDIPLMFRRYFDAMPFPCYYVPIKVRDQHYGFILKGNTKGTSRFSTYFPFFNLDALLSPRPYVFVVEGMKDAGMFLERGEPAIGMLTSGMSIEQAALFKQYRKVPILIPDNDSAGRKGSKAMFKMQSTSKLGTALYVVQAHGHKDMGDYYDHPELRSYVENTYRLAVATAHGVSGDVKLF